MSNEAISLVPWEKDKDRAAAEESEAKDALKELPGLVIDTQEDLGFAAELLAEAKGKTKALEEMRDSVVKPMNTALKNLRSWFKPALDALGQYERGLKTKIAEAHAKKHARQQEALKAAAVASMAGDTETAAVAMEEATEQDFEPVKGLSMRHTWDCEVIDLDEVPREYMMMDVTKVKAVIRAHKGDVTIPGIRVIRNTSVASASK